MQYVAFSTLEFRKTFLITCTTIILKCVKNFSQFSVVFVFWQCSKIFTINLHIILPFKISCTIVEIPGLNLHFVDWYWMSHFILIATMGLAHNSSTVYYRELCIIAIYRTRSVHKSVLTVVISGLTSKTFRIRSLLNLWALDF